MLQATVGAAILLLTAGTTRGIVHAADSSSYRWAQFSLPANVTVALDFRNASIDNILAVLSKASGVTIIADPSLTGTFTVETPHAVHLDEAFDLVEAALKMHGYALLKQGSFVVAERSAATSVSAGSANTSTASASDSSDDRTYHVYRIKYASAETLSDAINQAFGNGITPITPAQQFGFIRSGRADLTAIANQGYITPDSPLGVEAVADDYSNSVVVRAPIEKQNQIAGVIQQVDHESAQPTTTRIFALVFARATDLQPEVQSILSGFTVIGRAATATTTAQSRGSTDSANGTVAADARTNSLTVTSTEVNLDAIAQVIAQLDKPAEYVSTTFVYVLKNARADVVANLLNESFGNRTNNGPVGGSLTNPTFSASTLGTSSTTSAAGGGASGAGGSRTTGGGGTNSNFSVTSSSDTSNQTGDTTGLDENGHVVNIRNLSGQVVLVPNIDTNSIIVVAPPEYKQTVIDILNQMDEIPAQVMIQTLVVETNLDKSDQLGVEYTFDLKNPLGHGTSAGKVNFGTSAISGLPPGGTFTLSAGGYTALLNMIEQDTKYDVLSTPRIFTTNNATAQINVSQSLPYVTSSSIDPTTGQELYNYDFLNVGIVLTVTPRITSNGYVTMDVTQTANDFVAYTSFNAPIVNQRETESTISVKDGDTIVLGGIIQNSVSDTVNKIPLLGDIPILGSLFRSTSKSNDKTELLVFLTPHVVTNPEGAEALKVATVDNLDKTTKSMIPTGAVEPH